MGARLRLLRSQEPSASARFGRGVQASSIAVVSVNQHPHRWSSGTPYDAQVNDIPSAHPIAAAPIPATRDMAMLAMA